MSSIKPGEIIGSCIDFNKATNNLIRQCFNNKMLQKRLCGKVLYFDKQMSK